MPRNEDDLNWLYRDEPEETKVLPPGQYPGHYPADGGTQGQPGRPHPGQRAAAPPPPPPSAPGGGAVPATPPGRPPKRTGRRRRRPLLRTLIALVLAWLVFLVGTPIYAWATSGTVEATPSGERPPEQPGTTILLVGSDSRAELTDEEQKRLGTGTTEGRRTDTMMLLTIPERGPSVLLSLPRDSLVDIPGRKRNKLNAAYAFGGAPLLVETVEANTGIRVDGYFEIGFLGIVDVVDAVGGIQVCPTFDIDDRDSHLTLAKGCQQVDGTTALGYVRMRKADPTGDIGRMERQREVISSIMREVLSPVTVLNPVRYWQVNMAASKSLARGTDTGLGAASQAAYGLLQAMTGSGLSLSVPVSDANARTDVGSAMIWDADASSTLFAALASGDTTSLQG